MPRSSSSSSRTCSPTAASRFPTRPSMAFRTCREAHSTSPPRTAGRSDSSARQPARASVSAPTRPRKRRTGRLRDAKHRPDRDPPRRLAPLEWPWRRRSRNRNCRALGRRPTRVGRPDGQGGRLRTVSRSTTQSDAFHAVVSLRVGGRSRWPTDGRGYAGNDLQQPLPPLVWRVSR